MKHIVTLYIALLLAPLAVQAQHSTSTVRDHLWLFSMPPDGCRMYYEVAGYRGGSRMTPAEGAFWLGVPNLMFITQSWNKPLEMWWEKDWKAKTTKEQYAISFERKPFMKAPKSAVLLNNRSRVDFVVDLAPPEWVEKKAYLRLTHLPTNDICNEVLVIKLEFDRSPEDLLTGLLQFLPK